MPKKIAKIILFTLLISFAAAGTIVYVAYLNRDKLVYFFVEEANKYIKAQIKVGKIDLEFWDTFPYFSLDFQKTTILGTNLSDRQPFAVAERLYVSLSFKDLLERRYKIKKLFLKNAQIYCKIYPDGSDNFSIFKNSSDTGGRISFGLSDIILRNVRVVYRDDFNKNNYEVTAIDCRAEFALQNTDWNIALNGDLYSHAITLNNLTFFKDKSVTMQSAIIYSQKAEKYQILPSQLKVENAVFALKGLVTWQKDPYVDLSFSEQYSDFQTLISFLPKKISERLKDYKSKGSVYFNGKIKGYVKRNLRPELHIEFGCKNASFYHPEIKQGIENATFKGSYYNGGSKGISGSYFKLLEVVARLQNEPITGNFELFNLSDPMVHTQFRTTLQIADLLHVFPNENLKQASGKVTVDLDFRGRLSEIKRKNYSHMFLQGSATLDARDIILSNLKKPIQSLKTKIHFEKGDIRIDTFETKLFKSDLRGNGYAGNFLPYMLTKKEKFTLDLRLFADLCDLDEWNAYFSADDTIHTSMTFLHSVPDFSVQFAANRLVRNKINIADVHFEIYKNNRALRIEKFHCLWLKSKVQVRSEIVQKRDSSLQVQLVCDIARIPIDSVLWVADNFKQSFLTASNLSGKLTTHTETNFLVDKGGRLVLPSLQAQCELTIWDGQLKDFKPMQNLSKFVNEEALAHIKFSEIKNTLFINQSRVTIPEMTIKSSITTLQVQGWHQFDNLFEYKVRLPLKNYKKKGIEEENLAIEASEHEGLFLYLILSGTPDNFKVKYDKSAVKQKLKDTWKNEKKEFIDMFKKDYLKKKQEQQKTVELDNNEFLIDE